MDSYQGFFLIADPHLGDGNFYRSVVLIIQHDEQGAMGFLLNRPAELSVAEVWKDVFGGELECNSQDPIYLGGPVEGPLMMLHTRQDLAEMIVKPGLFVSVEREKLRSLAASSAEIPAPSSRLFSGYSGWGAGQLEQEIELGGWLLLPARTDDIFSDPDDLWKRACAQYSAQIIRPLMGDRYPSDPSLN